MGSNGVDEVMISAGDDAECSETTVEIKIKTLDSQTYTLRVNKRMPVPALKEQIATVTGVLSEQQRLICRGKVLKDDQLLSAYHVEDGHTLHLVVGQPHPPSSASTTGSESLPDHPATDPASGTGPTRGHQVSHSVVLGTFNIADQGDGVLPDLNRIISAVLGSIGIGNVGGGSEGIDLRERDSRTSDAGSISDSTRLQPDQATDRAQSDSLHGAFRLPTAVSLGSLQPPVIPDSLTTLSQYLSRMRHEFSAHGGSQSNSVLAAGMNRSDGQEYDAASRSRTGHGLPTPASLADVMLSTRQMLFEQAGECLSQLIRQLEDQADVTDQMVRMSVQSNAMRSGVLLQNLGAFLLELGRATITLRMGQTPSEAVVNAGPAVFISTSGPNAIMVQALPFQPGTSFGAIPMGSAHPGSGLSGGTLGSGFLPRNIDIRIHTGSSVPTVNVNQGEQNGVQQSPGGADPVRGSGASNFVNQAASGTSGASSLTRESGVRVVPIRTVVAAVPTPVSRPQSDSSGSSVGIFYPLIARVPHVTSGERHSRDAETERQPISESAMFRQNLGLDIGAPARDGNSENLEAQHQQGSLPIPNSRTENNLSSGGTQTTQESRTQLPSRFDQLLRTIFSGEQIHTSDIQFQGIRTGSATEPSGTTTGTADADEAASRVGFDEGIFFSTLLRQLIPVISQISATESNVVSPESANTSEQRIVSDLINQEEEIPDVGTSRKHTDSPPTSPSSKRQKRE